MNITRPLLISMMLVMLTACGGAEERKEKYMQRALESIEQKDYDKARIEIKNVLQIDPKHAEAYYIHGNIMEERSDFRKAFGNYRKAVELDPENTKYLGKLGQFLLVLANDIDGAREHMEKIKQIDEDNKYGLLIEAGIAARENQIDKAMEITTALHKREPGYLENAMFLAALKTSVNDREGALQVLQETAVDNPDNTNLMARIAGLLLSLERNDESEKVLKDVLALKPDVYDNYLNLAKFYVKLKRANDAREILLKGVDNSPDDLMRYKELLAFEQATSGLLAAIDSAKELIRKNDLNGQLTLLLANLHTQDNDIDSGKRVLVNVVDKYKDEQSAVRARIGLAEIAVQERNLGEARKYINQAYTISPNDADVNLMKARLALNAGNMDEGVVSLRTVIKDEPGKLDAYILLARAHQNSGEEDQAEDVLARAHENSRSIPANLLKLSKLYVDRKNFDKAEKVIDDFLKLKNNDYEALSIKVAALNARQDYEAAGDIANRLITLFPEKPNGYLQSVPVLMQDKKVDEVIELLDRGIKNTGNDVKIMSFYGRMVLARDGESAIEPLIERVEQTLGDGDAIESYMLLAKIYDDNNRSQEAADILDRGILSHRKSEDAYLMRASFYEKAGDKEGVIKTLEYGLRFVPEKAKIGIMLARIYDADGNNEKVLDVYRTVVKSGSANVIILNNLAALLVADNPSRAEIDEAVEVTSRLQEIDNHAVKDTVAWVKYLSGDVQQAETILARLVKDNKDVGEYHYHYGVVLNAKGDKENASKHLQRAVDSDNVFNGKDKAKALLEEISQ